MKSSFKASFRSRSTSIIAAFYLQKIGRLEKDNRKITLITYGNAHTFSVDEAKVVVLFGFFFLMLENWAVAAHLKIYAHVCAVSVVFL